MYIRLPVGQTYLDIPEGLIEECCQLVKANSIEGCKKASAPVVYTPWANLKKTADMAPGQVSFHDKKQVVKRMVEKKNPIVRRLTKTKEERFPDLRAEQLARQQAILEEEKAARKAEFEEQKAAEKAHAAAKAAQSYDGFMDAEKMTSNQYDANVDYREVEDDFM